MFWKDWYLEWKQLIALIKLKKIKHSVSQLAIMFNVKRSQRLKQTWNWEDTNCFWRSPHVGSIFVTLLFTVLGERVLEKSAFNSQFTANRLLREVEFSVISAKASFNRFHRTTMKRRILHFATILSQVHL